VAPRTRGGNISGWLLATPYLEAAVSLVLIIINSLGPSEEFIQSESKICGLAGYARYPQRRRPR